MIPITRNKPITTYILFIATGVHYLTIYPSGNVSEFMNCLMKQFVSTVIPSIKSLLEKHYKDGYNVSHVCSTVCESSMSENPHTALYNCPCPPS